MGVEKRVRSVRLSEEESMLFDRIQDKFAPFTKTFKDTVVMCARLVWRMICTPGILNDFIAECQRLQRTTSYTAEDAQLALSFPAQDGYVFRPKIAGRAPERPSVEAGPVKAVGMAKEMEARGTSFPSRLRYLFAQVSTRRAA